MKKVYIVHGWTYKLDKWDEVTKSLKKLDVEPIMLRVPGLSEPSEKVWDIDGYVDWLNQKLKDEAKPTVIGHSNGGRIATAFVQKYPNKLAKLILIDSAGVAHNEASRSVKLNILKYISKIGKIFSHIPIVKKVFYKIIGAQDYMNAPPNMKLTMRNMLDSDQNQDFSKIAVPTTIIWGRDDTTTPLSDGEKIHAGISGSDLHVIDDASHSPFFNHPEEVAKIIADSLGTNK